MKRDYKPKVCFSTWEYPPDKGGVGRSSQRIAKFLTQEGFDVHIFVPENGFVPPGSDLTRASEFRDEIPTFVDEDGIKVYRIAAGGTFLGGSQAIYQAIKYVDNKVNFDIFHGFFLPMAYPCILVAHKGKRPVIASIRGTDCVTFLTNELMPYITTVLQNASWVTSVSSDLLDTASVFSDISSRSSFIPNSIDHTVFPKWKIENTNRGTVGTVALFRPKKNIPLLINAYAELSKDVRERLLLVGEFSEESSEQEKVITLIEQRGLDSEVQITGFVSKDDVQCYLQSMSVFVQCSRHEGLPNALLEACATGVPIVASAIDGMKDILEHGKSALLIPPDSQKDLTSAIKLVLSDDSLAQELSQGALELAEQLRPEKEKRIWLDLYSRLLLNNGCIGSSQ